MNIEKKNEDNMDENVGREVPCDVSQRNEISWRTKKSGIDQETRAS